MQLDPQHLRYDFYNVERLVSCSLQWQLMERSGGLPFCRERKGLVQGTVSELMDKFATLPGWSAYRLTETQLVLTSKDSVMEISGSSRAPNVAYTVTVWSCSLQSCEATLTNIETCAGAMVDRVPQLSIHWMHVKGEVVRTQSFLENVTERLTESAYPWIPNGIKAFGEEFRISEEPILVLYGAPGVGKTQLIRYLLSQQSANGGKPASVLYISDPEVFKTDQPFLDFLTGEYDAMVIEDADHLLMPRSEGNQHLHRFLAASDGFIRPRGRRLIFSTNLPSKLQIDEALLRPGRCFGCVQGRRLTGEESGMVLSDLGIPAEGLREALGALGANESTKHSLAEIYACVRERRQNPAWGVAPATSASVLHSDEYVILD